MRFRAEEYFLTATERIAQAGQIHEIGESYALSMYCSGLAVECLLRAFRWEVDRSFDGRHDLEELLKSSGILKLGAAGGHGERANRNFRMAILEVIRLWHNSLRFCSEKRLRSYLKKLDRLAGVKGDPLRKNSDDMLRAAKRVLHEGVALWALRKKSGKL